MVFIYILYLQEGKYYIGKTDNPKVRIDDHFNSMGSAWTKLYKPIQVLEIIPDCDDYDEDKYTKIYMDKYGIDNVRGGSFVTIELDKNTRDILKQMSNGTNNRCFVCGKDGHFAKNCYSSKEKIITKEVTLTIKPNKCKCVTSMFSSHFEKDCALKNSENFMKGLVFVRNKISKIIEEDKVETCNRCGRNGHLVESCYASKHLRGYPLRSSDY